MFTNLTYGSDKLSGIHIRNPFRQKRHYDFVRNVEEIEDCYRPHDFHEDIQDACDFVQATPSCNGVVSLVNYLQLYVCTLQWDASAIWGLPSVAMALGILFLYSVSLYVNGRYFLLPNSIVLANYFKMPNYDFGCVVLATLFTLPYALTMIFSCVEYNRSDSLLHAQSFGKMFICLVIGLCLLSYRGSFCFHGVIFLREMFFLTTASVYLYVAVQQEMNNENKLPHQKDTPMIHIHAYISLAIYVAYILYIILISKKRYESPATLEDSNFIPSSSESMASDSYPFLIYNPVEYIISPVKQFLDCINPGADLCGHSLPLRIIMYPFYVIYALLIPIVNIERPLNGWCKFIFCCSCLIFPLYFITLHLDSYTILCSVILGISAAMLIHLLTHSQRLPTNHELLSFWGLIIGFAIFNIVDLEICCILWQFLNYALNMDNDVILIVAFPFSYIFVEGIFVVTLVENGYREMALGFVIGTVLFIAYSALPVMLFSVCFGADHVYSLTANTTTAFYFTLIVVCVTIFGFSLNGYELRPSGSIFFGLLALIFALYMILENEEVIHAYGTIHSQTVFVDILHNQWA